MSIPQKCIGYKENEYIFVRDILKKKIKTNVKRLLYSRILNVMTDTHTENWYTENCWVMDRILASSEKFSDRDSCQHFKYQIGEVKI
jgi:hypothetical protein